MTVEILYKNTSTLPSGFEITFTVGRIVKDEQNSPDGERAAEDPRFESVHGAREAQRPATYGQLVTAGETASQFIADPAAAADVAGNDLREPVAAEQGQIIREGDAPHGTERDAPRPGTDSGPPTFLVKAAKPLRPHCLHQDNLELCAGSGSKHCYSCLKARDEALVSA